MNGMRISNFGRLLATMAVLGAFALGGSGCGKKSDGPGAFKLTQQSHRVRGHLLAGQFPAGWKALKPYLRLTPQPTK